MRPILTLICLASLVPSARAGSLDVELGKKMPSLLESLRKGKVKNVGVMPFRVHEEGESPRFDVPLCGSLAGRLESLLIIHNQPTEDAALGVIRDIARIAREASVGPWFAQPAERAKLFAVRYPLAWKADRQVKPDLFLTGRLVLAKDRKRATLTIESFDRDRPETLRTVATVHVPTDRALLRDLALPISLPEADRQALAARSNVSAAIEDEKYVAASGKEDIGDPRNVAGIVFEVLVDGEVVPCEKKSGRWVLPCPPPDAKVAFRLINRAGQKRAVAVRLNGVNTTDERRDEPELCRKWLTEPKKKYTIKGFFLPGEKGAGFSPFKVLVGPEADAARREYGDAAGWIDVDVYEEGNAPLETASLVTPRGLPPSKEKEARASYLALRSALLKSAKLKTQTVVKNDDGLVTKREIVVADKDALQRVERPDEKDFPNPRLLSRLTIRVIPN